MAGFVNGLAYKHNPYQRTVKTPFFLFFFRMFTSLETNLFSMVGYSNTHKRMFISAMQVGQSRPPGGGLNQVEEAWWPYFLIATLAFKVKLCQSR